MKFRPPEEKKPLANWRQYGFLILTSIFILSFSFLFLRSRISEIVTDRQAISAGQQQLAQLTKKLNSLEGLNEYELSEKANRLLVVLPVEKNPPRLLATIRFLAESTGVGIMEVEAKPGEISDSEVSSKEAKKKEVPSMEFNLTINGSLESIKGFLNKLGSTAPLMRVKKVTLSQKRDLFQVKVQLGSFYLPLPKEIGAVEKPLLEISPEENKVYEQVKSVELPTVEMIFTPVESGKANPFIP